MNRTLPDRIFICGFMGAGKSTAGQALAKKLDMPFHDLDDYIVERSGKSIPDIFESGGEDTFRKEERAALLAIIRDKKGVIALGGGTLQNQHLVDHIKVNGLLAFIDTPVDIIIERIRGDGNRPLLVDESGEMKSVSVLRKELSALLSRRQPFYEQAEVTVHSHDYSSTDDLVTNLLKKIKNHVALH